MNEFSRIFDPKLAKAVKAIGILQNGHRYQPTDKQISDTLEDLKNAVNSIALAYGVLPQVKEENEKIASSPEQIEKMTSEERIEKKLQAIERSPFAHGSVDTNVRAIPDNQLTAYATMITHRVCERFAVDL